MLNLPKTTEFNKRIPKQTFYDKLVISPEVKRAFVEQIRVIYWRNKISSATLNVAEGHSVTEIEVFEIRLHTPSLNEAVLRQIDKGIPYHILFVLNCGEQYQAWIGYKETPENSTIQIDRYFHTDWMSEEDLPCKLDGLTIDSVYENLVRQIAGDALQAQEKRSTTLKQDLERDKQRADLQKKISALQAKIRKEKQLNRKMELNSELKKLKKGLEAL